MSAIRATGVHLRPATAEEEQAFAEARRGRSYTLPYTLQFTTEARDGRRPADDDVLVVGDAFVEFADDEGRAQRWTATMFHGRAVPLTDATMELLDLADEAREGLIDLLGDMRRGTRVSRWEFMSAPHRIDLEPALAERLATLRHG